MTLNRKQRFKTIELFDQTLLLSERYIADVIVEEKFKSISSGSSSANLILWSAVVYHGLKVNLDPAISGIKWYQGWFGIRKKIRHKYVTKHIGIGTAQDLADEILFLESSDETFEEFKKKRLMELQDLT